MYVSDAEDHAVPSLVWVTRFCPRSNIVLFASAISRNMADAELCPKRALPKDHEFLVRPPGNMAARGPLPTIGSPANSALWPALSEVSAGFTLSRSETTSSKARRYRDRAVPCRPVFVITCSLTSDLDLLPHLGRVVYAA